MINVDAIKELIDQAPETFEVPKSTPISILSYISLKLTTIRNKFLFVSKVIAAVVKIYFKYKSCLITAQKSAKFTIINIINIGTIFFNQNISWKIQSYDCYFSFLFYIRLHNFLCFCISCICTFDCFIDSCQ